MFEHVFQKLGLHNNKLTNARDNGFQVGVVQLQLEYGLIWGHIYVPVYVILSETALSFPHVHKLFIPFLRPLFEALV